jgi:hypothetical protein
MATKASHLGKRRELGKGGPAAPACRCGAAEQSRTVRTIDLPSLSASQDKHPAEHAILLHLILTCKTIVFPLQVGEAEAQRGK